ncbi:MAG: YceD family protein [Desulfocucumaceae bacterium]
MIVLDISKVKNLPGTEEHLVKDFQMQPIQAELDEISFNTPLRLDITLANSGDSISLNGTMDGNIRLACSRCLEYFDLPVREELSEVYYNESRLDSNFDEAVSRAEWVPFKGEALNITPEIVKTLLSTLPMKLICRDDCKGLCQNCGTNLNIKTCSCPAECADIRMAKLKELLEKSD